VDEEEEPSVAPPQSQPEPTTMPSLIEEVASKLGLDLEIVQSDFEVLKMHRINDIAHLRLLMKNKDLWKQLEIPLIEKCILEEILKHDKKRK